MSQTEDCHEARRWLDTAKEDLAAARSLAAAGHHAHACFCAQQCAEKAAKALWYMIGTSSWGHSVQALLSEFPQKDRLGEIGALLETAARMDRFYIATRYPNGLPDLTPEKSYFPADSQQAIASAEQLLTTFSRWIMQPQ